MDTIPIGNYRVTRFILGSNPFSGFSHQGAARDREMMLYYSAERIKETMRQAEGLGVNTVIGRADNHVIRVFMEYWHEGGTMQWFAQTCPGVGPLDFGVRQAIAGGAKACHIHGGTMDFLLAQGRLDEVPPAIAQIRKAGLPAGIAGHNPEVFRWAEKNLDVDYYLCSYYNSAHRDQRAEHVSGMKEWFLAEDRRIMTELIQTLSRPVIHYKIMAAGRNDPREAFEFVAHHLRPQDAVCVGVYTKDAPCMIEEDIRLLESSLEKVRTKA